MKKISDYNFSPSWQLGELGMKPGDAYRVLTDLRDLKKGELVEFIGFDDVDNHYGIFVFTDSEDNILEVGGDFSGLNHSLFLDLKLALARVE